MERIACILGAHEYTLLEMLEKKNVIGDLSKKIYVLQCAHCGKINHYVVDLEDNGTERQDNKFSDRQKEQNIKG